MGKAGRPSKEMAKTISIRDKDIIKLAKNGMSQVRIAKIYGVSRFRISQLVKENKGRK